MLHMFVLKQDTRTTDMNMIGSMTGGLERYGKWQREQNRMKRGWGDVAIPSHCGIVF